LETFGKPIEAKSKGADGWIIALDFKSLSVCLELLEGDGNGFFEARRGRGSDVFA
jgi:hypothetical protein